MTCTILAFGVLVDITQKRSWMVDDVTSVAELIQLILHEHPELNNHQFRIAVNQRITNDDVELHNGDTVALLPPFSGG